MEPETGVLIALIIAFFNMYAGMAFVCWLIFFDGLKYKYDPPRYYQPIKTKSINRPPNKE